MKKLILLVFILLIARCGFGVDMNELSTKTFTCCICGGTTSYSYPIWVVPCSPRWFDDTWGNFMFAGMCHKDCFSKFQKFLIELYQKKETIVYSKHRSGELTDMLILRDLNEIAPEEYEYFYIINKSTYTSRTK